jgi:hypothetical protein
MKKKPLEKSQPIWKKQKAKRDNSRVKEIVTRIFTATALFFVITGSYLIFLSFKRAVWDGKNQLNLIIQSDEIYLYSFQPENQILNIVVIPNSTYIPTAKNFGEYPIANIYKLGEQENIDGGQLLSLSAQNLLAVPIDGYIYLDNCLTGSSQALGNGRTLSLAGCFFKNKLKTNLTGWDLYRFINQSRSLSKGAYKKTDFSGSDLFIKQQLPDGSQINRPDLLKIDRLSVRLFSDTTVLNEALTVSVLNSTNKLGLANYAGRFIRNIGAKLVSTEDNQKQNESVIYYKNADIKNSYTLLKLKHTFQINNMEQKEIGEDMVIVLGEDFIRSNL